LAIEDGNVLHYLGADNSANLGRLLERPLLAVVHASRMRATPKAFGVANFLKDCFDETPSPTRETRALPGTQLAARQFIATLQLRFPQ
jgi:hypothetical protein